MSDQQDLKIVHSQYGIPNETLAIAGSRRAVGPVRGHCGYLRGNIHSFGSPTGLSRGGRHESNHTT